MAIIAPGAAFAPGGVALRAHGAPNGLICRPLAQRALPRAGARTPGVRMQEAATDGDAPADVFFSLKQRLQKANVWLIGMDGCGKEAIGKELAKKLGYKYMDTNEIIAALLKTPIETAMTTLGEEEFNKVERAVLDQVQAYYGTVVSTGSIAPVFPENWSKFRTGLVAYCKVPHDGLKNEGLQDALSTEAPLISGMPDESRMELLLAQRETKYEQADVSWRQVLAGVHASRGTFAARVRASIELCVALKLVSPFGRDLLSGTGDGHLDGQGERGRETRGGCRRFAGFHHGEPRAGPAHSRRGPRTYAFILRVQGLGF